MAVAICFQAEASPGFPRVPDRTVPFAGAELQTNFSSRGLQGPGCTQSALNVPLGGPGEGRAAALIAKVTVMRLGTLCDLYERLRRPAPTSPSSSTRK